MNKQLLLAALALMLIVSGCFKSNPDKEMMTAGGSWTIDEIEINYFDSLGNELNNEKLSNGGILMLMHDDDFLYESSFSLSYDSTVFSRSTMGVFFLAANVWGVSNGAKSFNLATTSSSTGYTTPVVSLTILKLRRNKMELQYVATHPNTGYPVYQEIWRMKRGTHQ